MQNNKPIKLPRGAISVIANRVNVSTFTVSCVLSGKKKSPRSAEIFNAAAEYVAEFKAKEQEARQKLDDILNG